MAKDDRITVRGIQFEVHPVHPLKQEGRQYYNSTLDKFYVVAVGHWTELMITNHVISYTQAQYEDALRTVTFVIVIKAIFRGIKNFFKHITRWTH